VRLALALLLSLSACSATLTTLKADGKKAIDCLKEAEPAAIDDVKAHIVSDVAAKGFTADAGKDAIEQIAVDETPAVVGCAAFALSVSSKEFASEAAAAYIAAHGLTFTASPNDAGTQ